MCDARHPEFGKQCESTATNHLDHYALNGRKVVTWPNDQATPVPTGTKQTRNIEGIRKVAAAVKKAKKDQRVEEAARPPTRVLLGPREPEQAKYQRHSDTSKAAALSVDDLSEDQKQRVLEALMRSPAPLTDQELEAATGFPGNTERPRRVTLVEEGLVCRIDKEGVTRAGRSAVRWGIVGRFYAEDAESVDRLTRLAGRTLRDFP